MSKQIRVSDAAYAILTREAKANHRSILADQVDAMVLDGGQTLTKETVAEWDRNGVAKIASTPNKQGTK